MKRKYATLAIMATSLLVMLIVLQFNVELTIAQNLSNDAVSGPLAKEEHIMIWRDILMGKIDKPPGAKDYVPPENLESLPKPTPSLALDQMIFNQNMDLNLLMDYEGIAAGYQVFDGGCVYAQTNSITNLIPDSAEYQVMHQWPTSGENAIVVMYYPNYDNGAVFRIYISALGGYQEDIVYLMKMIRSPWQYNQSILLGVHRTVK